MEEAKDNSNKKEMEEAKDNSNEKEMEEAKDNSNEKEMNKNENTLPSSASFEILNENNFEQWLDSNKITSFSKEKIQKAWKHLAKNLGDFIKILILKIIFSLKQKTSSLTKFVKLLKSGLD